MAAQRRPPRLAVADRVRVPSVDQLKALVRQNRPPTPRELRERLAGISLPTAADLKARVLRTSPETIISTGVVAAAMLFVLYQMQPSQLLADTTPSGGDTGAHVWGPDYLRHHLLPNLRITGWAPDWYAGFPAYHFYFPLPALMIVALDLLLPYGVAFKLVTVLGVVTLPLAVYAFGRLAGMRFPGPPVLAAASLPFLFDRGFTIYGGNIASTLAGEFSFSISLSVAFLFLGVVARGLDTGRHRALAALLLTVTGLCHLLPTIFAVVGACVLYLLRPGRSRARFVAGILAAAVLLAAFWSFPFLMRLPYANNMGWEKITAYTDNLFPDNLVWLWFFLAPAGAVFAIANRRRVGMLLVGMAAVAGALFVLAPPGRLWNARVLPFWFVCLYLLAGVAVAEAGPALGRLFAADPEKASPLARRLTPLAAALAVWMFVGLPLGALPGWLPQPNTTDSSYIDDWARWNYSGYERKPAWDEYRGVVDMMGSVGRSHGCGRAHWEYEGGLDRFGTPMALMLLPYWTDGCIGSMEGLYFESSATVPYHFLSAAELSKAPSNPMRDLPYPTLDLANGVRHLQMLGARYYIAFSPEATAQAESHPDLTLVAVSGAWKAYEVRGSELVSPLAHQPAVLTGGGEGEKGWLAVMTDWFLDFSAHEVHLAASGPEEWPRVAVRQVDAGGSRIHGAGVEVDDPERRRLPPVQVSDIRASDNRISFDVDQVGTPVLVKASYFPNWKVSGGKGPYRVSPNLMVVVPTSNQVSVYYGWTPVDLAGWMLTLAGLWLVATWAWQGRVTLDDGDDDDGEAGEADGAPPAGPGERSAGDPEPAAAGEPVRAEWESVAAADRGS